MTSHDLFSSPSGDDVDPIADHTAHHTADHTGQLRLLDTSDLPLQFRLDKATRERGLAHVAELRRLLARQAAHRAA